MSYSSVKLVAITKPVIEGIDTAEDFVAYAARVSNPTNQFNLETSSKLLKYLIKHKHWSPFEMVQIVMEINTTRDIARQILRHRSFSFQEFSQRYSTVDSLGFINREARLQDSKNRQNSIDVVDRELTKEWYEQQTNVLLAIKKAYAWALSNGIAKEQARAVLPEGLTMSKMYMAGSLRSWLHYISVRMDPSTQKEHREVAEKVFTIIKEQFPSITDDIF